MSQIPMTPVERIDALRRFGYGEREAAFLSLAALHGGYFLRRQYIQFLGQQDGGTVGQLMQKALGNGHVRVSTWRQNTQLYHLCARPFYEALGQEDNRNRRQRQLPTIKNKIMGLDFVLAHPHHDYLATELEKLTYFAGTLGLEKSLLPIKRYTSRDYVTERYFVEKYPIFLSQSSYPAAPPVVSFCFVDEGAAGVSGFSTFLDRYRLLLRNLREFQVIYVAATDRHFESAKRLFARFLKPEHNGCGAVADESRVQRMVEHFEARRLYETQQWHSFDRAKLIRFRNERDEFSGPEIEALYQRWKTQGQPGVLEILQPERPLPIQIHGTFSTNILEHDYGLFGRIAAL